MSESKSQDHWKALAELLDVSVPDEPEEAPVTQEAEPETAAGVDPQAGVPAPTGDESSEETPLAPPASPAEPPRPPVPPARSRPAPRPPAPRADANHWRGLAGALGIEVPDEEIEEIEEVEEVEEAVVEAELVAEPEPVVEPDRVAAETDDTEEDSAASDWSEPSTLQPAQESMSDWLNPVVAPDVQAQFEQAVSDTEPPPEPPAPPKRSVPSLFDDKSISIDTPGVLDRIFEADSDEERRPAIPAGFEEREAFSEIDDDLDEGIDSSLDEEDDEAGDDAEEALGSAAESQPAEAEGEGDEPRRRRRRRRRRRKPGKSDSADAATAEPDADSQQDDAPREAAASEHDLEDELHDDVDDHDDGHHDDEDDDELLTLGVKHRKIPTWDEAVQVVISANMESRAKNPGNGPRGRGRGRGRRP
ncbi:MAG: hypothetical protein KJ000_08460 [Pirellulaceae bacterium]|nr:hypothetical protein [Pirellulaceae bacterium]